MGNKITFAIPEDAAPTACRGCGALIYWVLTAAGKKMPVDPDGTSHFATCAKAGEFRKAKGGVDVGREDS